MNTPELSIGNSQMSEDTANELLKAIEDMSKNTPFLEGMEKLLQATVDSTISTILFKEAALHLKYLQASFLTRWYWKRKHEKAKIAADKLNEFKAFVLSNMPIPNIDYSNLKERDNESK